MSRFSVALCVEKRQSNGYWPWPWLFLSSIHFFSLVFGRNRRAARWMMLSAGAQQSSVGEWVCTEQCSGSFTCSCRRPASDLLGWEECWASDGTLPDSQCYSSSGSWDLGQNLSQGIPHKHILNVDTWWLEGLKKKKSNVFPIVNERVEFILPVFLL